MTPEQMETFVQTLQLGWACGLEHIFECLANDYRFNWQIRPLEEAERHEKDLQEAFLAFFHGCGSCPGDPIETLTWSGLVHMIDMFYNRNKVIRLDDIRSEMDRIKKLGMKPVTIFMNERMIEQVAELYEKETQVSREDARKTIFDMEVRVSDFFHDGIFRIYCAVDGIREF